VPKQVMKLRFYHRLLDLAGSSDNCREPRSGNLLENISAPHG